MRGWIDLPLDRPLFANVDPDAVVQDNTAIENGFISEKGMHVRFPGLMPRVTFGDRARVYLHDFDGDLIAANDLGHVYRIDRSYNVTDVTGLAVAGGRRPIFAKTDRELLIAAGGDIVRLRDRQTELLSAAAPKASHIAWLDNFTIAVEINSGRFFHSVAGEPDHWDPLDSFAADGNPDNINSLIVTPFRQLMLGGDDSIEQFERLPTGDAPFFRRWSVAEGVKVPYGILFADNAVFCVNNLSEFIRFSGQTSQSVGDDIGKILEAVDDWTDTWLGGFPDKPLHLMGQKLILLQMPRATNAYGTKGITLLYDYRQRRWSTLYGFRDGVPQRWPGWSHWLLWNKQFVGGEGVIYELSEDVHTNGSETQRWLVRTAHIAAGNAGHVKNLRLQVVRGRGGNVSTPQIRIRCSKDAKPFSPWINRSLGRNGDTSMFVEFGPFGMGSTFQFEIACTDDVPVDLIKAQVIVAELG
ncbi:MAG: hypothetical protein IT537_03170 [Hyphomicrobiales bacterium]|nr:hypothetical protein [Hyphomicrobiales bacterium]